MSMLPRLSAERDAAPAQRALSVGGLARALRPWRSRRMAALEVGTNLKLRLSLLITTLMALITIAGGTYVVGRARADVRAEVRSTMNLTGHFLDAQLLVLTDHWTAQGRAVPLFQLSNLHEVRHLEVKFYDNRGQLLDSNVVGDERQPQAPAWFMWLVRRSSPPMADALRSVSFKGVPVGQLVIHPDPSYEVDEIWTTSKGLVELLLLFFVLVNALVWLAVAQALRPVELILGALGEVERGNLRTRLPRFSLPEMSRISAGFNHMAQTLEHSVAENRRLTRQLIQVQEGERRNLARELHDEIGQSVSAIHADAVAIRNRGGESVRESAEAIVEVIGGIKHIVRSMLQRLRPGTLEGFGLRMALRELVAGFQQRNPDVQCNLQIADASMPPHGEVGLALYRVVQECLSNIAQHAAARQLNIGLRQLPVVAPAEIPSAWGEAVDTVLELSVSDDGRGFDPAAVVFGFGLLGMRERVRALGGDCQIHSAPGQGTRIVVSLPATNPAVRAA